MAKNHGLILTSFLVVSVLGGALISALLTRWVSHMGTGWYPISLFLGALFGFLGWLLSENIGDAVVTLIGTSFPGLVLLAHLDHGTVRVLTIAFLCGFNVGKLAGGVYRELT